MAASRRWRVAGGTSWAVAPVELRRASVPLGGACGVSAGATTRKLPYRCLHENRRRSLHGAGGCRGNAVVFL